MPHGSRKTPQPRPRSQRGMQDPAGPRSEFVYFCLLFFLIFFFFFFFFFFFSFFSRDSAAIDVPTSASSRHARVPPCLRRTTRLAVVYLYASWKALYYVGTFGHR